MRALVTLAKPTRLEADMQRMTTEQIGLIKGVMADLNNCLQTSVPLSAYVESRIRIALGCLDKVLKEDKSPNAGS